MIICGVIAFPAAQLPVVLYPGPCPGVEMTKPPWLFLVLYALEDWIGLYALPPLAARVEHLGLSRTRRIPMSSNAATAGSSVFPPADSGRPGYSRRITQSEGHTQETAHLQQDRKRSARGSVVYLEGDRGGVPTMAKSFSDFVIRCPIIAVAVLVLLTLFFGYQITTIKLNADFTAYLQQDNPFVEQFNRGGEIIAGKSIAIVLIESEDVFSTETLTLLSQARRLPMRMRPISQRLADRVDFRVRG